mmetsp:Transcript_7790/g.10379  ORF Transcript_7790/g.10379 Transcript_7790/m.10379 type:complete len:266 (-) Transcript_7790:94-891(-)|eukprot:CAMPEP_0117734376 /NCGR_PEP_ID=MMETSP0947-20121206/635_1 /TAXON_ID=44440 /ORGANISM="Chattonella subsalsa, Strain CCMP2191" /LENGTH=265 /DNA_ID=CAMNT_0005549139 /DNA_START=476 /DNA_END=1273 /DNA_ORIENTATION=+
MDTFSKPDNRLIFLIYDGTNYPEWAEVMELVLMNEDLWGIVCREETGSDYKGLELKRFVSRFRKAYSLISLNCNSTTREVLRQLGNKDPHLAWKALEEDALSKEASNKLVFIDTLLDIRMKTEESVRAYEAKFNAIVNQLKNMGVTFDPDLLLSIFLRGLPNSFKIITTNLRHRPGITVEEAVKALIIEEKAIGKNAGTHDQVLAVTTSCEHCGKRHKNEDCWTKYPEKRPRCNKCGGRNHWGDKCRSPSAHAHIVTAEEEAYVL